MPDVSTMHGLRTTTRNVLKDLRLNSVEEGRVVYVYGFRSVSREFISRKGIINPEIDSNGLPITDDSDMIWIGLLDEDVQDLVSDYIIAGSIQAKLYTSPYTISPIIWFDEENEFIAKNKIWKYFQKQIKDREYEINNYKDYAKRVIDSDYPKSVQDVVDTMSDEQTEVLNYLVGRAIQGISS